MFIKCLILNMKLIHCETDRKSKTRLGKNIKMKEKDKQNSVVQIKEFFYHNETCETHKRKEKS